MRRIGSRSASNADVVHTGRCGGGTSIFGKTLIAFPRPFNADAEGDVAEQALVAHAKVSSIHARELDARLAAADTWKFVRASAYAIEAMETGETSRCSTARLTEPSAGCAQASHRWRRGDANRTIGALEVAAARLTSRNRRKARLHTCRSATDETTAAVGSVDACTAFFHRPAHHRPAWMRQATGARPERLKTRLDLALHKLGSPGCDRRDPALDCKLSRFGRHRYTLRSVCEALPKIAAFVAAVLAARRNGHLACEPVEATCGRAAGEWPHAPSGMSPRPGIAWSLQTKLPSAKSKRLGRSVGQLRKPPITTPYAQYRPTSSRRPCHLEGTPKWMWRSDRQSG